MGGPTRQLGGQRGGDVGPAGELVEEEGHGRGRRVVAGEEHRHDLVAHVAVAEPAAVLVLGVEQQREQVLAALAGPPAARDLGVDAGRRACAARAAARPTACPGRAAPAASTRARRSRARARTRAPGRGRAAGGRGRGRTARASPRAAPARASSA